MVKMVKNVEMLTTKLRSSYKFVIILGPALQK